MVGVPVVREITEAEYRQRRAEITASQRQVQRERVIRSLIAGGDALRNVYPQRDKEPARA